MKKVFITYKLPGSPEKYLKQKGFEVSLYRGSGPVPRELLIKNCKNADALLSLLTEKIDREVIDSLNNCKIIANCAVGYNNIDVEYAKSKNIIVTNTPDILTDATADLTIGLILACARRFYEGEKMVRSKKFFGWKPDMLLGMELKGKTVGIIGAGRIGFAAAKRIKSFGTNIIYFDRNSKINFDVELNAKKVSLDKLLKTSDIISVHLPLNKGTFHFLNRNNLIHLKPSAIIVNTSRGEVIEEKFLINLLKKNKIFSAGFDVYEGEPKINPGLLGLNNAVLIPHLGSATIETRSAMAMLCAENILEVLNGNPPVTPV